MSGLEARYRRILTVLPRAYRQRRAEEMLTAMLDGAPEGQRWPRLGEVASVAGLAVRLRTGAPGGSPRARVGGRVLRRIGLAGLVTQALLYVHYAAFFLDLHVRFSYQDANGLWLTAHYLSVLLPLAALAALLYGWRRTGRALAFGQCVLATVSLLAAPVGGKAGYAALAGLSYLVACGVMLGFHRDAPAPTRRGVWLALACALLAAEAAVVIAGVQSTMTDSFAAIGMVVTAPPEPQTFALSPLGPALAIGTSLLCARRSAVWPTALFALGLPLLVIAPYDYGLFARGWTQNIVPNDLTYVVWSGFGLQWLAAEVALAGVLIWSLRRHRTARGEPHPAAAD